MKIDQLRHFYATARLENIGKAAKSLRVSPSGICYSIECLEKDLDVRLFQRVGKYIKLTPEGKKLLSAAPQFFDSLSTLRESVAQKKPGLSGHYNVGASHTLSELFLLKKARGAGDFLQKSSFSFSSISSAKVVAGVLDQTFDFGFCFSPHSVPGIEKIEFFSGTLLPFAHVDHPLHAQKKPVPMLSEYSAAFPKAAKGIDVCAQHPVFSEFGVVPDIKMEFDDYGVALAALENTELWALLPDFYMHYSTDILPIKTPKSWRAAYDVSLVYRKGNLNGEELRDLRETLLDQ